MRINLNIERLVLNNLPTDLSNKNHIQRAVENELSTLLIKKEVNSASQSQNIVNANDIHIGKRTSPRNLGIQIAGSVVGGLGK